MAERKKQQTNQPVRERESTEIVVATVKSNTHSPGDDVNNRADYFVDAVSENIYEIVKALNAHRKYL